MTDWLPKDPGGLILGALIGIIVTYIFFRVSREAARPTYFVKTLKIIEQNPAPMLEDMKIVFGGQTVPRLTKTTIIFWNAGRKTLRGADIVEDDPLRFCFMHEGAEILRATVTRNTRFVNDVIVEVGDWGNHCAACGFDFLDHGDGATIELLHTSPVAEPVVLGTIRGIPKGLVLRKQPKPPDRKTKLDRYLEPLTPWIIVLGGIVLAALGITDPERAGRGEDDRGLLLGAGFMLTVLGAYTVWSKRRLFPKLLDPADEP